MDDRIRYVYKTTREDKFYIGSTFDTEKRWKEHAKNSNSKKMKKDIDKYGWDSFTKEVIFSGTEDEAYTEEIRLIYELKPYYNNKGDFGGKIGKDTKGENNSQSKLCEQDIKDICKRVVVDKELLSEVRKDYPFMGEGQLYKIVRGKAWTHINIARNTEIIDITGENNSSAKLKEIDIIDICNRIVINGETVSEVSNDYSFITKSNIYEIINNKSWVHVIAPRKEATNNEGDTYSLAKLTEKDIIDICNRVVVNGETVYEVSKDYPFIDISRLYNIINGKAWNYVNAPRKEARPTKKRITKIEALDIRNLASEGFSAEDIQKYIYINKSIKAIKKVINRKTFANI